LAGARLQPGILPPFITTLKSLPRASLIDDLVEELLRFADLRIHPPAGPGLGVTLDQDKLRRYARR
jgi:L-alanine-DL-glutamate epimerase-like enolase superfamily enzyme